MVKVKGFIALMLAALVLLSVVGCKKNDESEEGAVSAAPKTNYEYVKAVWISYYEIGNLLKNLNNRQISDKLDGVFNSLSSYGINTAFFHVRAFADAFYKSKLFPPSDYAPKDADVLSLAVKSAHKYKISIHAWINPYRVSSGKSVSELPASGPCAKLYKNDKNSLIIMNNGIYLNPSSRDAQKLILDGVREIVDTYDVDGIHYDDYFYPSPEKDIDKQSYEKYKKSGGELSCEQFRTENVNCLIAQTRTVLKKKNPNLLFSVSPQASMEKNKTELFADVSYWIDNAFLDFVCPQIYFGFENEASPYEDCVKEWVSLCKDKPVKLIIGLALYKCGQTDEYAAEDISSPFSAYYEWQNNDDIISRQIQFLNAQGVSGFSLFSYSSLFPDGSNKTLLNEVEKIKDLIKN